MHARKCSLVQIKTISCPSKSSATAEDGPSGGAEPVDWGTHDPLHHPSPGTLAQGNGRPSSVKRTLLGVSKCDIRRINSTRIVVMPHNTPHEDTTGYVFVCITRVCAVHLSMRLSMLFGVYIPYLPTRCKLAIFLIVLYFQLQNIEMSFCVGVWHEG